MSTEGEPRERIGLAQVTQVIRYAQFMGKPDVGAARLNIVLSLHGLPGEVFDAMLAEHDDLRWDVGDCAPTENGGPYRRASLRLTAAMLDIYSERDRVPVSTEEQEPVGVCDGRR